MFFAWRVLFAYKRVIPRSYCVEVTACKSSHGQESYLRVLNVFLLAKNIALTMTLKTSDIISRRFGDIMTPLSRVQMRMKECEFKSNN